MKKVHQCGVVVSHAGHYNRAARRSKTPMTDYEKSERKGRAAVAQREKMRKHHAHKAKSDKGHCRPNFR